MSVLDKLKIVDKSSEEIPEEIGDDFEQLEFDGEPFDQDPTPDETAPERNRKVSLKPVPSPAPRVTAKVRKEIAEEIAAYLEVVALTWSLRDEPCASALSDASQNIADKLTNILAKNPRLLTLFRQAGFIGDWVQLYIAAKPVVEAIYRHHVKRETEGGEILGVDLADFPAYRAG